MGRNRGNSGRWAGKHARWEGCGCSLDEAGEGPQEGYRGPDGGIRANVENPLKVPRPGGLFCRTAEDGVLERLRGALAPGAGGGTVVGPGRVGAEVALTRSHLVEAARGKPV